MKGNIYVYILIMAAVTYLIRVLPLTLIRKRITSPFIRSFLYYVPYVTLTVMTFPSILSATSSTYSAVAGFATAIVLSYCNRGLIVTSLASCAVVYLTEFLL